jgi:hypothetical protein
MMALAVVVAATKNQAAASGATWPVKDVEVSETAPGQPGAAKTRLETGADGDARITVDLNDEKGRTNGTILLISGRWMVTRDLTPEAASEIDLMDIAALNSQLVIKLLAAALPDGPPQPGHSVHVSLQEKSRPIQVATSSASGEYNAPWTVDGTVTVPSIGASAAFQLTFAYTDEKLNTVQLVGTVGNPKPPLAIPDSFPLAGWIVHRLGRYQEQTPNGTKLDYGARPSSPAAKTVGELRSLDNR